MPTRSLTTYYPPASYSARYSFSAKEKDEETGYSVTSLRSVFSLQFGNLRTSSHCTHLLRRFGARYYNSDLSIWLSVDPMSDKYPSLSPYAYCANNPVILVDPDGKDIWTIYEDGTINRKKNTKIDRIDVVDGEGNITKGTEAKYGTIKQHTLKAGKTTIDYFEIKGDKLAKETFENISNTNTDIEWAYAEIGEKGSNRNIIGTSHANRKTNIINFLLANQYTIRSFIHNHPSGYPIPSGQDKDANSGDIPVARDLQNKFPDVKQSIYVNGKNGSFPKGYYPYNKNGIQWGTTIKP